MSSESNVLFFEIPDNAEVMGRLIQAVPLDWLWVDGVLVAPEMFITSGQAEKDTGYTLQRFHSIQPTIIGNFDSEKGLRNRPNLYAIMVEAKRPGFVIFDEVGLDSDISLGAARKIAIGLLVKGYRGSLRFYKNCHNDCKHENPAYCGMVFEPWCGYYEEAGPQPARVRVEWTGRYGGKEEDIDSIVKVCRALCMKEYKPVASR